MAMTMVSDKVIEFTRTFKAPPERVFDAWSRCEDLMQWWGPREWPLAHCDMDFRPGGSWHYCMRGPDGAESWGIMTYREIERPNRIVYTDAFSDASRAVVPPESLGTVVFAADPDGTLVTMRAAYEDPAELKIVVEMGMEAGLEESLDRLVELLAK